MPTPALICFTLKNQDEQQVQDLDLRWSGSFRKMDCGWSLL